MKNLNQIADEIRNAEKKNDVLFIADIINGIILVAFGFYLYYVSTFIF